MFRYKSEKYSRDIHELSAWFQYYVESPARNFTLQNNFNCHRHEISDYSQAKYFVEKDSRRWDIALYEASWRMPFIIAVVFTVKPETLHRCME